MGQFNITEMNHQLVQVLTEHQLEHQLWINLDPFNTTLTIFDYQQGVNLYLINLSELQVLEQSNKHHQLASEMKVIFDKYYALLQIDTDEGFEYDIKKDES